MIINIIIELIICAWVYAIYLSIRQQKLKQVKLLQLAFFLLLLLSMSIAAFYIVRAYLDNGADCSLKNIACQANLDFLTGVSGWGTISIILLIMNSILLVFSKRKRPAKQSVTLHKGSRNKNFRK